MSGPLDAGVAGKVVAITGASGGIGAATARFLAERGAQLILGARRLQPLEALAADIRDGGGEPPVLALDAFELTTPSTWIIRPGQAMYPSRRKDDKTG